MSTKAQRRRKRFGKFCRRAEARERGRVKSALTCLIAADPLAEAADEFVEAWRNETEFYTELCHIVLEAVFRKYGGLSEQMRRFLARYRSYRVLVVQLHYKVVDRLIAENGGEASEVRAYINSYADDRLIYMPLLLHCSGVVPGAADLFLKLDQEERERAEAGLFAWISSEARSVNISV